MRCVFLYKKSPSSPLPPSVLCDVTMAIWKMLSSGIMGLEESCIFQVDPLLHRLTLLSLMIVQILTQCCSFKILFNEWSLSPGSWWNRLYVVHAIRQRRFLDNNSPSVLNGVGRLSNDVRGAGLRASALITHLKRRKPQNKRISGLKLWLNWLCSDFIFH